MPMRRPTAALSFSTSAASSVSRSGMFAERASVFGSRPAAADHQLGGRPLGRLRRERRAGGLVVAALEGRLVTLHAPSTPETPPVPGSAPGRAPAPTLWPSPASR